MREMANPGRTTFRRLGTALALVLAATLAVPVWADSAAKRGKATQYYEQAVAERQHLETLAESERGPAAYQKIVDTFQRVYLSSAHSSKADDSLFAMGEIYEQMSRRFGPDPYRKKEIDAYQLLIKEYPYSPFSKRARKILEDLEPAAGPAATAKQSRPAALAPAAGEPPRVLPVAESQNVPSSNGLPQVTDLRFWSSPGSTRVVVNLESDVKIKADRLTNPDRIYFDLPQTRLGPALKGKTIPVGDELVKQIRMGNTQVGVTRVVVDLNRDAEYTISALSNPPRVVVEIRQRGTSVAPLLATAKEPATSAPGPSVSQPSGPAQGGQAKTNVGKVTPSPTAVTKGAPPKSNETDPAEPVKTAVVKTTSSPPAVTKSASPKSNETEKPAEPLKTAVAKTTSSLPAVTKSAPPKFSETESPAEPPKTAVAKTTSSPQAVTKSAPPKSDETEKPTQSVKTAVAKTPLTNTAPFKVIEPDGAGELMKTTVAKVIPPQATSSRSTALEPTGTESPDEPVKTAVATATPSKATPSRTTQPKTGSSKAAEPESSTERATKTPERASPRVVAKAAAPKAAQPTSLGERDLIRALGLKISRVVIDAGHGGHDTGTIGPTGLTEKDLTLDVARRLGELISARFGSEVIYTRSDDTFIPLDERTALANEKQADLFISIHANSSSQRAVRGIETYYLDRNPSSREALEVAARENAASQKSIHDLQDLVSKIVLNEKISESREFAHQVQRSLYGAFGRDNVAMRNRGVRRAPFFVLIGARMPSVLAEISFLSNARDEKLLKNPVYRQKVAEALYNGLAGYARTLSRMEVAANPAN